MLLRHDAVGAVPPPAVGQVVPRRLRPGTRATGRSGIAPSSSPGALDFVVEPLRPLFDEVVCAQLGQDADGVGSPDASTDCPPTGEARALVLAEYAAAEGLDLGESVAYADSASDLPLLECVGFPVAVNPEAKLAAIARRRGWHVEHWDKAAGGARPPLPFGPVDHDVSRWWARLETMAERVSAPSSAAPGARR